jgi:hypothetical protein
MSVKYNSFSPFELSFAAFNHFVEFGDDAVTLRHLL